jgi:quercetin dioxygenase-like cupin family protein
MNVTRATLHPARRGSPDYFTGTVWLEDIGGPPNSSRVRMLRVSFEPGARTAWHTHPHGQTLHILNGTARAQKAGEPVMELHAGDTVWFEAGERHWHGAGPNSVMVHLAVQPADAAGNTATWLEQVSDADYNRGAS